MESEGVLEIRNARLTLKNFSGKEKRYNAAGKRNFCILLDEDTAQNLAAAGWNVRHFAPRDDEENGKAYMQITVSFDYRPPKIVLVSGSAKDILDERDVHRLDEVELTEINIAVRPYRWERGGKSGIKGYLKTFYARLVKDEFEGEYDDSGED